MSRTGRAKSGKADKRLRGKALVSRARSIRFLLLDVDGVLTDGSLWFDEQGREVKGFSIYDGLGIRLLREAGVSVGFLSGRRSEVVAHRAKELGVEEVHLGIRDKVSVYEDILLRLGLTDAEVAYVGDDLIDLPILLRVGLSVAVPNAVATVLQKVQWVTKRQGGEGAVREVADVLLKARRTD